MPFKSEAQRRFMYANHPAIARRWSDEYKHQGKLPAHVGDDGGKSAVVHATRSAVMRRLARKGKA